jgi:quercetin dioxygenase-like cupin family protein
MKLETMSYYSIKDIAPRKPTKGVELRAIHGERMTVGFFTLAQGAVIPEHAHPHEQIGTVLSGSVEIAMAGEKKVVHPGGAYIIPAGVTHSGLCIEGPAEVIEIFAPVREEWLRP